MKNRTLFLLAIIMLIGYTASGQENKPIHYTLPPPVDSVVYKYVKSYTGDDMVYGVMRRDSAYSFRLIITTIPFADDTETKVLPHDIAAVRSNRMLLLNKQIEVPLVLQGFDNLFINQEYLKKKDSEVYGVTSNDVLYHSFSIKFNMFGTIYSVEY